MNKTQIMSQIEEAGILNTVKKVPLIMPNGVEVPNKYAIVDAETEKYVSVVGGNYNIIQNEEVFSAVASSIEKSGIKTDGMTVNAMKSETMARQLVSFRFPEHSIEMKHGDVTDMQIVFRNSLDGTWLFRADVGGFRIACANGQVYGDYENAYQNRHTKSFSLNQLIDYLTNSVDRFADIGIRWAEMRGFKITKDQAIDMFLEYLGKQVKDKEAREKLLDSERAITVQHMMGLWTKYFKQFGSNMYCVYNCMTDHATHVGEHIKSKADVVDLNQRKITKIIDKNMIELAA